MKLSQFCNNAAQAEYCAKENALLLQVDYELFQEEAGKLLRAYHDQESIRQWLIFVKHLNELSEKKPVKLLLLQVVSRCFSNPLSDSDLAQFITLAIHVKSACGIELVRKLSEALVPEKSRHLAKYVEVLQLLLELHEMPGLLKMVTGCLPDLEKSLQQLQQQHIQHLAAKYPKRDIDMVLARFSTVDDRIHFTLEQEALSRFKTDYLAIVVQIEKIQAIPQATLRDLFLKSGKATAIAITSETIRRRFNILPYDTQIIALLALLDDLKPGLKGRIAQIQTGEGKLTILAMLAAYKAKGKKFVNVITSSDYLAIRDCDKYRPFFEDLGLTVSHICYVEPRQEDFHTQILYGKNSDFEFALLRDGLNKQKLQYSYPLGETQLVPRTEEVVIIDEVDNMLLDKIGTARIATPGFEDNTWIYRPILEYLAKSTLNGGWNVPDLRSYLKSNLTAQKYFEVQQMSDAKLTRWLQSAQIALCDKLEDRDYIVKSDIIPTDYENTGRKDEGSQWQHGVHQFLQAKHKLVITPESLTSASIAHPTYFGAYQEIYGVSGTIGELIERKEIEDIYHVDSFDVPPHFPNQRQILAPRILAEPTSHWQAVLEEIQKMKKIDRPVLVLFESIKDSVEFSTFLSSKGLVHQLLNEKQRESEDYIIARAGEAGMITVATNSNLTPVLHN
jgi:preprotein translocase subunit SecA